MQEARKCPTILFTTNNNTGSKTTITGQDRGNAQEKKASRKVLCSAKKKMYQFILKVVQHPLTNSVTILQFSTKL